MNHSEDAVGNLNGPLQDLLYDQIKDLVSWQMREMLRQWNRSVPMGDLFLDRWTRAQQLGFGKGTSIYDSSVVLGDVKIGDNTWIGPFTVIDGSGGLTIGDSRYGGLGFEWR